jgi:hypothetical protein
MDRLPALQAFARVVELDGFTNARGDSPQASKTTVSDLVQGLEKHLRVRLLQRTTRRVSATSPSPICEGGILRGCAGYLPLLKSQAQVLEIQAEHLVEEHP